MQQKVKIELVSLLDRVIVFLMAAIALTLAWPVGMVFWHQSQTAGESTALCLRVPLPSDHYPLRTNRTRTV